MILEMLIEERATNKFEKLKSDILSTISFAANHNAVNIGLFGYEEIKNIIDTNKETIMEKLREREEFKIKHKLNGLLD